MIIKQKTRSRGADAILCDHPALRDFELSFPCPHFSAGERSSKYRNSGFWTHQESAVRIGSILFFAFSVSQCLRGDMVLVLLVYTTDEPQGETDAGCIVQGTGRTGETGRRRRPVDS